MLRCRIHGALVVRAEWGTTVAARRAAAELLDRLGGTCPFWWSDVLTGREFKRLLLAALSADDEALGCDEAGLLDALHSEGRVQLEGAGMAQEGARQTQGVAKTLWTRTSSARKCM